MAENSSPDGTRFSDTEVVDAELSEEVNDAMQSSVAVATLEVDHQAQSAVAVSAKRTTTGWSVDYAKSDRCQCRYTDEPIELGEMRIVKETISHEGFRMAYSYKVGPAFQLMARMAATTKRPGAAAELHGYAQLPEADQQALAALFDRFHSPSDGDPPLPVYSRASQKERRFKRPRADERRFICPAPGCTKAYASTGCLSRHKKPMHPEMMPQKGEKRPRMRYPALTPSLPDPAPAPSTAAFPTSLEASAVPIATDFHPHGLPWTVDDPLHQPLLMPTAVAYEQQPGPHAALPAPPAPAAPAAPLAPLAPAAPLVAPAAPLVAPAAPAAPAAPPVAADSATRRHVCPAPGCTKAYSSAHCLYIHKRNHHPELITPRAAKKDTSKAATLVTTTPA